jgi:hypothetical protein
MKVARYALKEEINMRLRFQVNFEGVVNGTDTYHKRIYLEQEDRNGFLRSLAEKNSKIDGFPVITIIRDDIYEEIKVTTNPIVETMQVKNISIPDVNVDIKTKRMFKCLQCDESFNSGVKLGRHKKTHLAVS